MSMNCFHKSKREGEAEDTAKGGSGCRERERGRRLLWSWLEDRLGPKTGIEDRKDRGLEWGRKK